MSTYGTISSEAEEEEPSISKRVLVSKAKERLQTGLGTRRPWDQMIQPCYLRFPLSFFHSIQRIKTNAEIFRANYVIIILLTLFLSLLWHPMSLIMLILMMAAWLFLYFLRDQPLIILGYEMEDPLVASSLLLLTMAMLFLTNVTNNAMVGISVGVGLALVHAVMRDTENFISVDEEAGDIVIATDATARHVPLKHPASSTFTLS